MAFAVGVVSLTLATTVFGVSLAWATLPLAIPTAFLGAFAFLPLALFITAAVVVAKQAGSASTFIVTGLSIVSGVFFPIAVLPAYLRWLSEAQPFSPALELLRYEIVGAPLSHSAVVLVAKLAGFALVLLPPAVLTLSAAIRFCRRRGTLTEY
jgi:ABC-2 type transport system permease protein